MPADESTEHREKAREILERLSGAPSKDNTVAATVGLGYAVLAVFDELRVIRELAFPPPKTGTAAGFF